MVERIREVSQPKGCSRLLFRLPINLYRLGLGWMLGSRFVLLTHTGRQSGRTRRAVLEILRQEEEGHAIYVTSAWGERADWLQNVRAHPEVEVQVGRRSWSAHARLLSQEQGAAELGRYAAAHPTAAKGLARILGYRVENAEQGFSTLAEDMVVVALERREQD
jgi:deazaflavin-dependent oxidoreductase (nitroreductase family)